MKFEHAVFEFHGEHPSGERAQETLSLGREFNRRAGFTSAHDRLPDWMTQEPLPPHNSVFDVPEQDLDGVFNW